MSLVVMSQTVGALTSGGTYRVRAKTAELLIAQGKASKSPSKRTTRDKEGK